MKIFTSVASATALMAVTAFTQPAAEKVVPAARPALRPATTKGVRSVTGTQDAAAVVAAANTFIGLLSATQVATLEQTFNSTNVAKWSNLPCGSQCRIGLQLSNLTTAQQTAALAVVQAATGTVAGDGYDEIQQIRAADDYLNANGGGSGYGSGLYFLAFLGTPSTSGTWMLQFGGHHLATNITYTNGAVAGATPKFEGVEPLSFTSTGGIFASGTTVAPLSNEAATMLAMLNGLTATQKTTAKLNQTFSDVLLGPNTVEGSSTTYPATKVGIQCSQLSTDQQALVMAAMRPWVQDSDDATATALLNYYQTQLANTYISYAGTGNLTTNGDYVRIDGPNVWIEFVCQTGVVFRNNIHYHSIWRDRARDYGGNFYNTVTATKSAEAAAVFGLFPSPILTGNDLQVRLAAASAGTYTVRNLLGQQLATGGISRGAAAVPTTGMVPGVYLLTVEADSQPVVTSRFVVQ